MARADRGHRRPGFGGLGGSRREGGEQVGEVVEADREPFEAQADEPALPPTGKERDEEGDIAPKSSETFVRE